MSKESSWTNRTPRQMKPWWHVSYFWGWWGGFRCLLGCYQAHCFPKWLIGKESVCQWKRRGFNLWIGKTPWRRKWQPTLVFLPGKSHGQRSLVGYCPWGRKRVRHDLATKTTTTSSLLWPVCHYVFIEKTEPGKPLSITVSLWILNASISPSLFLASFVSLAHCISLTVSRQDSQSPLPPTQASMSSSKHSVPELLHFYLICMQVRKQQLELDMEQQIGSK